MSQKSLYDFETEQIDKMFDCKNYLFKNSKHEKVILESDTGVKMVRHIIYKPADVSVYQRLALINNPIFAVSTRSPKALKRILSMKNSATA